jgi:drug/metabolite transporter (DMT)-like permease
VRTAIIAALEPLSTATLAVLFLGDPLRAGTLAGGVLILVGAIAAGVARARRPEPETSVP